MSTVVYGLSMVVRCSGFQLVLKVGCGVRGWGCGLEENGGNVDGYVFDRFWVGCDADNVLVGIILGWVAPILGGFQ